MKIGSKIKKIVFGIVGVFLFFIIVGLIFGENESNQINNNPENIKPAIAEENIETENTEEILDEELFLVSRVIDGDTIELANGKKVRYIGVETPEVVHPSKPVECFGQEASEFNKNLVEGKNVRLEKDISETDRYGRLLRYVYIDDVFVNDYLIRNGYAYSSAYPPDVKYHDQFLSAQTEARENGRGLWNSCNNEDDQNNTAVINEPVNIPVEPDVQTEPEPEPNNDYICSYNAYNCGDFTTHAQAQAVYETCGGVSNDVHKLDRDLDGLACETLP